MILPPPPGLFFEYSGPVRGVNRRLAWSPRAGRAFPDRLYADFKRALVLTIRAAMGSVPPWPFPLTGPLALILEQLLPPRMDADALIKPIMDALELAGAIVNDHQLQDLHIRRVGCSRSPWLRVTIAPVHIHAPASPPAAADPRPRAAAEPHNHAEDV